VETPPSKTRNIEISITQTKSGSNPGLQAATTSERPQLKSFTESMGSAATAKSAENRIAVAEGTGINSTFQTIPSLALSINDGLRVRARKPKSCSSWQTVDCEVQVITVGATAVISGISEHVSEHPTPPGTFHWLPRGS